MEQTQTTNGQEAPHALTYEAETLSVLCQLAAGLFRHVLDGAAADRLAAIDLQDGEGDFVMEEEDCAAGMRLMQGFCAGPDRAASLLAASNDFHDLFVGPHKLLAAPWSSVYLDKGGMIFGPTALQVRDFFTQQGFEIPEGTREPSDHIAYEWQFVADMQKAAVEAWSGNDEAKARACIAVLDDFVARYLSPWAEEFLALVSDNAATDFYRGLSLFSHGLWQLEKNFLKVCIDNALEIQ
ncbi:MAG: molecular chaperone TorD family protein [Eggerthellaceae bacterium]|nr:molecular chaperone TorD family protein [Eggerthellaceae bacterium]